MTQFLGVMLDPFVDGRGGIGGGPALGLAPEREALPEDVALAYAKAMKAPAYKAAPVPSSSAGLRGLPPMAATTRPAAIRSSSAAMISPRARAGSRPGSTIM